MLRVLIPILLLIFSAPAVLAYDKGDYDRDGINNYDEQAVYFTNAWGPDTDKDGYSDGEEIKNAYNPLVPGNQKLEKRIEINTTKQELDYFLGGVRLGRLVISSGKPSM